VHVLIHSTGDLGSAEMAQEAEAYRAAGDVYAARKSFVEKLTGGDKGVRSWNRMETCSRNNFRCALSSCWDGPAGKYTGGKLDTQDGVKTVKTIGYGDGTDVTYEYAGCVEKKTTMERIRLLRAVLNTLLIPAFFLGLWGMYSKRFFQFAEISEHDSRLFFPLPFVASIVMAGASFWLTGLKVEKPVQENHKLWLFPQVRTWHSDNRSQVMSNALSYLYTVPLSMNFMILVDLFLIKKNMEK